MRRIGRSNEGQALLIVLLAMAVVLTLALSFLTKSVTDISVNTKGEQAFKAFSAAEAGVEEALITGAGKTGAPIGDAAYTSQVLSFLSGATQFVYPTPLVSGDTMTIWLVNHDGSGNLTCNPPQFPCFRGSHIKLCWGNIGALSAPAIEASIFYASSPNPDIPNGDFSSVKIKRAAYDPFPRTPANNFAAAEGSCTITPTGGSSQQFLYSATIDLGPSGLNIPTFNQNYGLLFARIRFLYNTDAQQIGGNINPNNINPANIVLPSQGINIISSGTSGESTRKLSVFQSYGEPPSIFDSVLFSPNSIVHQ